MEIEQLKIQNVKMNYEIDDEMFICNISVIKDEKTNLIFTYEYNINLKTGRILKYKELSLCEIKQILNIIVNKPMHLQMFLLYLKRYECEYTQMEMLANKILKGLYDEDNELLNKVLLIINSIKNRNNKTKPIKSIVANETGTSNEDGTYFKTDTIRILREDSQKWESIYNQDFGRYYEFDEPHLVDVVHEHVKVSDEDVIKMISMLKTKQEFNVVSRYLKLYQRDQKFEKQFKY